MGSVPADAPKEFEALGIAEVSSTGVGELQSTSTFWATSLNQISPPPGVPHDTKALKLGLSMSTASRLKGSGTSSSVTNSVCMTRGQSFTGLTSIRRV
ncbi:MAG TPA: hypothetical protein VGK67_28550 [Myxococcales bacterium]|jgi:hypothetical protein